MAINQMIGVKLALSHTKHGLVMYRTNDMYLGKCLDIYGEFSDSEIDIFRRFIKPNMLVIDVGSNIGIHTLEMSKLAKIVISIESERLLYQTTCANIALNDRRNVVALHAAAAEEIGSLKIPNIDFNVDGNFGCMQAMGHNAGDVVRKLTLDSLDLKECGFIKIDVEGMELNVINGALKLIQKHRPILYIENDRKDKSEALIQKLLDLNYRLYWHFPPLFNPNNFAGNKENIFHGVASLNMICFSDDREFKEGYHITSADEWWETLKVVHAKEIL